MTWDDVDRWRKEAAQKSCPDLSLAATECAETGTRISADRQRTARAALRIARGFHPFGMPLREPQDETCGTCVHLRVKEYAGRYFKCAIASDTRGPGTDLCKKWPACTKWEARP